MNGCGVEFLSKVWIADCRGCGCRGYVALAVARGEGITTAERETGLGGDRQANMVAFAVAALQLLLTVVNEKARSTTAESSGSGTSNM